MLKLFKKVGSFFLDVIEVIVIALSFFVVLYLFLFQPHQVRGSSMYPSFYDQEYLLTDKISYRFSEPERGDVIIFKAPRNEEFEYIKRIIGLPGEKIRISEGKILVNERPISEPYLSSEVYTRGGSFLPENQVVLLGADEYFVLGDNRPYSSDSRDWGVVGRQNFIGKAWIRYWPIDRAGAVEKVTYF